MAADGLMATAVRLGVSVDALAALAAFVRLETEQLPADPAVRDLLGKIAGELVDYDVVPDPASATSVLGLARTFLRQAEELIDNPGRSAGGNRSTFRCCRASAGCRWRSAAPC